jgi:hypothetical protein
MAMLFSEDDKMQLFGGVNCTLEGMPRNCSGGFVTAIYSSGSTGRPQQAFQHTKNSLDHGVPKDFHEYFTKYAAMNYIYKLPKHFIFCYVLENIWKKTVTGKVPEHCGGGVRWHAGNDHNIWLWGMSDRCHDWNSIDDCHEGTNNNNDYPSVQAFMLWMNRQNRIDIGTFTLGKWTRSTHKHGRVRGAMYMPSDYTGEFLKRELGKVKDHMAEVAKRWPTLQQKAALDPVAQLW